MFQPFINSFYFDNIFMLGGISSTIMIWKKFSRNLSVKTCFWLIVDRFLRFQGIFLTLALIKIILPILGQGPAYEYFTQGRSKICVDNLLRTIFHLNNLIDPQNACLIHMWTFPVEFQLFIVAVVLIYLVRRGLIINIFISFQGVILLFSYTISVFYNESIIPIIIMPSLKASETLLFVKKHHMRTLTHAWSYVGSILLIVFIIKGHDRKFSPEKIRRISKILIIITFCALFNSYLFTFIRPTPLISAAYNGLHFTLFAAMTVFVLLSRADDCRACIDQENYDTNDNKNNINETANDGSPVKKSVKEKVLQNESVDHTRNHLKKKKYIPWFDMALKLTRNAYFVHDLVIMWITARLREPIELMSFHYIHLIIIMIGSSYLMGFLFQIFVVGPTERLHGKIMRFFSRKVLNIAL